MTMWKSITAQKFGLQLKGILAGSEILSEKLIPEFQIVISEHLPRKITCEFWAECHVYKSPSSFNKRNIETL